MKKSLKWIVIILIALTLLIIGTGIVISYFYEDKIVSYVVGELNNKLKAQVDVKNISFTLFRHFPNASLVFSNIMVHSPKSFSGSDFSKIDTDTLLYAKDLSLDFNLIDIFKKKYNFRQIYVENGNFNYLIAKDGTDNLDLFQTNLQSDTSAISIDLQNIIISNMHAQIRNIYQDIIIVTFIRKLDISGNFSDNVFNLTSKGNILINRFVSDRVKYLSEKNLYIDTRMQYANDNYQIEKGKLRIFDVMLNITGSIDVKSNVNLDIHLSGDDVNISKFFSLLPNQYAKKAEDYKAVGILQFDATIIGQVNYKQSPHIESTYSIQGGKLTYKPNDITLENINFDGTFSNGKSNSATTTSINMKHIDGHLNTSQISGKFMMENFKSPRFNTNFDIVANLKDIKDFFDMDTLKVFDGKVQGKLRTNGSFNSIHNIRKKEWAHITNEGYLLIENGVVQFKNQDKPLKQINGKINFKNDKAVLDSMKMNLYGHPITADGTFYHILSYLFDESTPFSSNLNIKASTLDMKDFLQDESIFDVEGNSTTLPKKYFVSILLNVDTLIDGKFSAEQLHAEMDFKYGNIHVNHFSCNALNGTISGVMNFTIDQQKKFEVAALMKSVELRKAFTEFDNFDQNFIMDKNLKGKLTANVNFSSKINNDYSLDENSILMNAKINIDNGELISFEPMQKLSKFVDVYELSHINFSNLENEIFIQNKNIIIPQMHIKSSAMELDIAGKHSFDNVFEYHVKVLMSELLSKKAKQAKQENSEFGVVESDGSNRTSLYLLIAGTPDDYTVGYDSESVKNHINERLKEEKETLKQILKKEFHWFTKDTTYSKKNKKNRVEQSNEPQQGGFEFKFE